jgi:lipoprotein-anchoring transpeptidase ErfK/SrfK
MRRLVAISSTKSKIFAASVGVVFSLTSIHLAATARIASLKKEQEQLERSAIVQPLAPAQNAGFTASQPAPQISASVATVDVKTTNTLKPKSEPPVKTASSLTNSSPSSAHQRQIIISIADRQLAVIDNGAVLKTYSIAVGARGTPSPNGDFVIINHAKDPTYRHGETEMAPGKDNPLGSRWMGLNLKGYGIHGTNVQSSVGKAVSHGCFRMRKQDVEELYTLMQVGDTVMVRRERDAMIAKVFNAPSATPAAINTLATGTPNNSGMQVASSAVIVETLQQ